MTVSPGRAVSILLLACGLTLATAAGPRVVAHMLMSAGEPHLAPLKQGEVPSRAQIRAAIASRSAALRWADLPSAWIDLGGLHLARAADPSLEPRIRNALLDQSLDAFRQGLAAGPARPYGWTQFAQAAYARGLSGGVVSRALGLSIDLAANERPLVIQRVRFGFRARNVLTDPAAGRVAGQVRLMAQYEPHTLAEFARKEFALAWVRAALRSSSALLARFDAAYLRLPPA